MNHIAIHSVPRSGSSWLGEIINSSPQVKYAFQPLFSYKFKGRLSTASTLKEIDSFYQDIEVTEDDFVTQIAGRQAGIKPLFTKSQITHVAYKEVRYHYVLDNLLRQNPAQKVIALVRNPLSVLSSWKNAPKEFRADLGWSFENEWKEANLKNQQKPEEYFGFDRWKETTLLFKRLTAQYPDKVRLIFYSDLVSNTEAIVKDIFNFVELDYSSQTQQFVAQSIKKEVVDTYSVYKQKQGTDNSYMGNISTKIIEDVNRNCEVAGLGEFLL
ncbi:MAG: sulfotransferase domain-containing protein [Paraglaciecola sp.]|uniref:sulfotransferase domain-containing protein n=1 Tax=Paraglaciecola sp. TaxID=1920173 RepID=UPI003299F389